MLETARAFAERGLATIPIQAGKKSPGHFVDGHWRGLNNWTRYARNLPTESELETWFAHPDTNCGLTTGALNKIVGVDIDDEDIESAVIEALPPTTVQKRGNKGRTLFYQYNGEKSERFAGAKGHAIDLLAEGKQTVVPPSMHPSGKQYQWLTEDTLENTPVEDLPRLPDDYRERILAALGIVPTETQSGVSELSPVQEVFRECNNAALVQCERWVNEIFSGQCAVRGRTWRAVAIWRDGDDYNIGIHPEGVKDFAHDEVKTPIDIVMKILGCSPSEALAWFKDRIELQNGPVAIMPTSVKTLDDFPTIPKQEQNTPEPAAELMHPPGKLGEIAQWITSTAIQPQPILSVQSSLAIAATVAGRRYITATNCGVSLYLISVARTGAGKDHPQQCVERCLEAADRAGEGAQRCAPRVAGSYYTSAPAVFSTLLRKPSHTVVCDEIGRNLASSRRAGNAQREEARTALMEVFGRSTGVVHGANYAMRGVPEEVREKMDRERVVNPSITIFGSTTPRAFYDSLTNADLEDGFLNRFLIAESETKRAPILVDLDRNENAALPSSVTDWLNLIATGWEHQIREQGLTPISDADATIHGESKRIGMTSEALQLFNDFSTEMNDRAEETKSEIVAGMYIRASEIAVRVASLVELGLVETQQELDDVSVSGRAMAWSIDYVRHWVIHGIERCRHAIADSEDERIMNKILMMLKEPSRYAQDGIAQRLAEKGFVRRNDLLRQSHLKKMDFDRYVDTLIEREDIELHKIRVDHENLKTKPRPTACYSIKE